MYPTNDTTALAVALGSGSPLTRAMARGIASGWPDEFAKWANAELARPKANPVEIMQAAAELQVQCFASMIAQLLEAQGIPPAVELYVAVVKDNMAEHAGKVQAELRERGQ